MADQASQKVGVTSLAWRTELSQAVETSIYCTFNCLAQASTERARIVHCKKDFKEFRARDGVPQDHRIIFKKHSLELLQDSNIHRWSLQ
jgi:hypothetical protein